MSVLSSKIALVTGASSGNGAAIAIELVKQGMTVLGVARRMNRLEEVANKLKNANGKFHILKADMLKEADIINVFEHIRKKFGHLDVLVNNAGIAREAPLISGNTSDWKAVLDTNILGFSIATREAVKMMKATNVDGYIINIGSLFGTMVPTPIGKELNMYAASKYAVTAMTEALRQELLNEQLKIRVSNICPGFITTELLEANKIEKIKENLVGAPFLKSEDLAELVTFLLTRPSRVEIPQIVIRPQGERF